VGGDECVFVFVGVVVDDDDVVWVGICVGGGVVYGVYLIIDFLIWFYVFVCCVC